MDEWIDDEYTWCIYTVHVQEGTSGCAIVHVDVLVYIQGFI